MNISLPIEVVLHLPYQDLLDVIVPKRLLELLETMPPGDLARLFDEPPVVEAPIDHSPNAKAAEKAERVAALVVDNPILLDVAAELARGPRKPSELADNLRLEPKIVARALELLKRAGKVESTGRGKGTVYQLTAKPLVDVDATPEAES